MAASWLRTCAWVLVLTMMRAAPTAAQAFSLDARRIALGGAGTGPGSLAVNTAADGRAYRAIVVPVGLPQLVRDLRHLVPGDDTEDFDPFLLLEYAATPLHYVPGRGPGDGGGAFVADLLNGRLDIDLSGYRGFAFPDTLSFDALVSPNWGTTIPIVRRGQTAHGIYAGAGPYLAAGTTLEADTQLTSLLAGTIFRLPRAALGLDSAADGHLAAALTGGYRGRIALPAIGSGERDGLYVAANVHYLHGIRYVGVDSRFRFDTNALGFVIDPIGELFGLPAAGAPIVISRHASTSGRGHALDAGLGVVADRWEISVGAAGIANGITWRDLEQTRYSMTSVLSGGDFVKQSVAPASATLRTSVPVAVGGHVGYHANGWSAMGDVMRGLNGTALHLGYERRLRAIELRGGGRYSWGRWHPSGGIGFTASPRVGFDVAAFTTTANIQRRQKLALAASVRLHR